MPALDSQVLGCVSADFLHCIAVVKLFLLVSAAEICLSHCNSLFCLQESDNVGICITYYAALFTICNKPVFKLWFCQIQI